MARLRSTNAIKLQRIKEVQTLLILGRHHRDIIFELTGKWNCSDSTVDRYIKATKLLIQKHFDEEMVANLNEKYDYLFEEALKFGDKALAKAIVDSKYKLKNVVSKVEHSGTITEIKFINANDRKDTGN